MLRGNRVLAILRESKNKWEQRAPLAPRHVKKLVAQGFKVLVQPSTRRAFYDSEYSRAGATITEDVRPASLIMGVKEVPTQELLPDKDYLFFSHVTKAQEYNMEMLDIIIDRNIRLFDYEMITETGQRNSPRLVAFGRFAGIAGMVDMFRGLGERLLSLGHANPFLKVGSTYMYSSLEDAERAVRNTGIQIADTGTPADLGPLVFTFTGDGAVSRGAQEIFNLLPHEWVSPTDLEHLTSGRNADLHKCYAVLAEPEQYVTPREGSSQSNKSTVDRRHYYANPHEYKSRFHEVFLPHTSVLMNCMFWTQSFPRIVTDEHVRQMDAERKLRLLAVGDISCDHEGSVEFLKEFSTIEDPFYMFDPQTGLTSKDLESHGILMQAVDTLPAELPKDATEHFGEHLMPLLPNLMSSDGNTTLEQQKAELNPSWYGAMITAHGQLTPEFEYITKLRASNERLQQLHKRSAPSADASETESQRAAARVLLRGHLFDNQIINKVLDIVETIPQCDLEVIDWQLGTNRDVSTSACLEITALGDNADQTVSGALASIQALITAMEPISPVVFRDITGLDMNLSAKRGAGTIAQAQGPVSGCEGKSVLVLGSGMVAGPALDVMVDSGARVTVASNDLDAANDLVAPHVGAAQPPTALLLDMAEGGVEQLDSLVKDHDIVVSLLPASMHVEVAEICLSHGRHFVSASYESEAMRSLDSRAQDVGVTLLNEMGLDPGIDHMSAMQIIDQAKANGEQVVSFSSLCGGLPAPDAANNPLGYKFSWNPAGVLQASQNSAQFLHCGQLRKVDGSQLMLNCRPVLIGSSSALNLEQLPNRDSLIYQDLYGLESAHTVYRGTLRYRGFAPIVHALGRTGLFDAETPLAEVLESAGVNASAATWKDVMQAVVQPVEGEGLRETVVERLGLDYFGSDSASQASTAVSAFEFLGLFGKNPDTDSVAEAAAAGKTVRDALCDRLQERLSYSPGESDMVLLHHEFLIRSSDGSSTRRLTSTLQQYGKPYPEGPSAMATTVGLPVGLAALMILNGTISRKGAVLPLTSDIYDPVLSKLEELGVRCVEDEHIYSNL